MSMQTRTKWVAIGAVVLVTLAATVFVWLFLGGESDSAPRATKGGVPASGTQAQRQTSELPTSSPLDRVPVVVPAPAPAVEPAPARIDVLVIADRASASGVAVQCFGSALMETRTTDEKGKVGFDVPAGTYTVRTVQFSDTEVVVGPGETRNVELTFQSGILIHGRVEDVLGNPVAGARILAMHFGSVPQWRFSVGVADAAGTFEIGGLSRFMMVGAEMQGYGQSDWFGLGGKANVGSPLLLRLRHPLCGVLVKAVDREGNPIRGARTSAGASRGRTGGETEDGRMWQEPPAAVAFTDAAGECTLAGLVVGELRVECTAEGHATVMETIIVGAQETARLHLTLADACVLEGRVEGAGVGLTDARLEWTGPSRGVCETTEGGGFRMDRLAAGIYSLSVWARGWRPATIEVSVAGRIQDFVVTLNKGFQLRGELVDDRGGPLSGWSITSKDGNVTGVTAKNGAFAVGGFAEDLVTIDVRRGTLVTPVVASFEVVAGPNPVRLVVRKDQLLRGIVKGRCRSTLGEPLPGTNIEVVQAGRAVVPEDGIVRAEADGAFTIALPPGTYDVWGAIGSAGFCRTRVEVPAGGTLELGDVDCARMGSILVKLTEPWTAASADAHSGGLVRRSIPAAGGRLIEAVPAGKWRVDVKTAASHWTTEIVLTGSSDVVECEPPSSR